MVSDQGEEGGRWRPTLQISVDLGETHDLGIAERKRCIIPPKDPLFGKSEKPRCAVSTPKLTISHENHRREEINFYISGQREDHRERLEVRPELSCQVFYQKLCRWDLVRRLANGNSLH